MAIEHPDTNSELYSPDQRSLKSANAASYALSIMNKAVNQGRKELDEYKGQDIRLISTETITKYAVDNRFSFSQRLASDPNQPIEVTGNVRDLKVFDRRCLDDGQYDIKPDEEGYIYVLVVTPTETDTNWIEKLVPVDKLSGPIKRVEQDL